MCMWGALSLFTSIPVVRHPLPVWGTASFRSGMDSEWGVGTSEKINLAYGLLPGQVFETETSFPQPSPISGAVRLILDAQSEDNNNKIHDYVTCIVEVLG